MGVGNSNHAIIGPVIYYHASATIFVNGNNEVFSEIKVITKLPNSNSEHC